MNKRLTVDDYLQMPWHYCTKATQWGNEKGFWIGVAELPDCSTFASSIEEGLSLMPSLLKEYLQVAIKSNAGIPIPEQNLDPGDLAGKLLVRIPASLHMGIKNAAKRENVSINQFALQALTAAVTKMAQPSTIYGAASSKGLTLREGANALTKSNSRKAKKHGRV